MNKFVLFFEKMSSYTLVGSFFIMHRNLFYHLVSLFLPVCLIIVKFYFIERSRRIGPRQ